MAFKALLSEEYINRERAPILSEKQMRNTISYRRQCKMMELMHRFLRVVCIVAAPVQADGNDAS
jgi:hypothetical protein